MIGIESRQALVIGLAAIKAVGVTLRPYAPETTGFYIFFKKLDGKLLGQPSCGYMLFGYNDVAGTLCNGNNFRIELKRKSQRCDKVDRRRYFFHSFQYIACHGPERKYRDGRLV